jgi:hypothetical protein
MTITADSTVTAEWGAPDEVIPNLLTRPIAASANIYGGAFAGVDASGNARQADDALCVSVQGLCLRQVLNSTVASVGPNVQIKRGAFVCANGTGADAISAANIGQPAYVKDANTAALTDTGGRLWLGTIIDFDTSRSLPVVAIGMTYGEASGAGIAASTAFRARAVVTTLQAYGGSTTGVLTETSNGAISAADGVTLVVGDVVFIEEGTTNITAASDAGPYIVTALGGASAKWVLTRPTWWATGTPIVQGVTIQISGEGTLKGGTSWKSFAAKAQVVDTNDPVFWVDEVTQTVTLTSSTVTISNVGVRSATKTLVIAELSAVGGTTTSTVGYGTLVAPTPGAIGTASIVIDALASGMTKNGTADTSTLIVTVMNW